MPKGIGHINPATYRAEGERLVTLLERDGAKQRAVQAFEGRTNNRRYIMSGLGAKGTLLAVERPSFAGARGVQLTLGRWDSRLAQTAFIGAESLSPKGAPFGTRKYRGDIYPDRLDLPRHDDLALFAAALGKRSIEIYGSATHDASKDWNGRTTVTHIT